MQFKYNDKTYTFDVLNEELPVSEARLIKQHAGMTVKGFFEGISEGDVDSMVGLVFLAVRRAGDQIEWSDLDDMDLVKLMNDIAEVNDIDLAAVQSGGAGVLQEQMNRAQRRIQQKKTPAKAS